MIIRYFDHAATTAVKEEVLKEMIPYYCIEYGNASSLYSNDRKRRKNQDRFYLDFSRYFGYSEKKRF